MANEGPVKVNRNLSHLTAVLIAHFIWLMYSVHYSPHSYCEVPDEMKLPFWDLPSLSVPSSITIEMKKDDWGWLETGRCGSRILKWRVNFCNNAKEPINIWGKRKKRNKGAQKKRGGGENSPISPPLDLRLTGGTALVNRSFNWGYEIKVPTTM